MVGWTASSTPKSFAIWEAVAWSNDFVSEANTRLPIKYLIRSLGLASNFIARSFTVTGKVNWMDLGALTAGGGGGSTTVGTFAVATAAGDLFAAAESAATRAGSAAGFTAGIGTGFTAAAT